MTAKGLGISMDFVNCYPRTSDLDIDTSFACQAGSPLFSRLWTYDEIQQKMRDPSSRRAGGLLNAHLKTPKGWPSDTKIDPGRWVFWLPEGWKQAKRTHETSGNVLTCYFKLMNLA